MNIGIMKILYKEDTLSINTFLKSEILFYVQYPPGIVTNAEYRHKY